VEMHNQLDFADSASWHAWLHDHHASESVAWLVYHKQASGQPSIDYETSVEEALCFGWIDSIIQKIDEQHYARKFTPRTNTVKWSESNRRRVRKLIGEGRMTPAGMDKVTFDLDQVEVDSPWPPRPILEFTPELVQVFQTDEAAWKFFNTFPPSERRNVTGWIMSAKREETRLRRLDEAMSLFAQGQRLGLK
jgi:uncharacterized protein YdeI (YjbR/CyaY-like superfamily)